MKTVLITGTSSGIGYDLAAFLVKKGYQVLGLSRRETKMEGVISIHLDITKQESIKQALKEILQYTDHIDYLIQNAGMGIAGSIENATKEDIELQFNTNLFGPIYFLQACLKYMSKGGRIIHVGSMAGDLTIPYQSFYSMSKAALDKFSEALSMELYEKGIKVTTVLPGDTKTEFTKNRKKNILKEEEKVNHSVSKMEKDEQKGASPHQVSKVIYRVMKRKHPPIRVAVGFPYRLFLFLERILPRKAILFFIRKLYR